MLNGVGKGQMCPVCTLLLGTPSLCKRGTPRWITAPIEDEDNVLDLGTRANTNFCSTEPSLSVAPVSSRRRASWSHTSRAKYSQ
jgi:hypothetical protein